MRIFRILSSALVAVALAAGSAPVRAQEPVPVAEAQAAAPVASQEMSTQVQSLPQQYGPPRTMRAYWHLFAAFAFAWLAIFGYAISLVRRFRRLEQQLDALPAERVGV